MATIEEVRMAPGTPPWEVVTAEQIQHDDKQEDVQAEKEGQPKLIQRKQVVRLMTLQATEGEIYIGPKLTEFLVRNPE